MRKCDLHTGFARLRKALETLELTWRESSEDWNDVVSHKFHERHLQPLVLEARMALEAISRMQLVVDQAQRDCES